MALSDPGGNSRKIIWYDMPVPITLAGTVYAGDPIGYSGGWVQADANATIYAVLVAVESGVSTDKITAARMALIDGYSGGTAGGNAYLSDTAGSISETASTTAGQLVGNILTTELVLVDFNPYRDSVVYTEKVLADSDNLEIETATDTKNVRINSRDYTRTSGDTSAVQVKPDQTITGTAGLTGIEVSPRFSDAAGGSKLVGIMSNPDLKGSSGDLTSVIRCYEAKFDGGTGRTVTGPAYILDAMTANAATITNGCFVIGVQAAGGGGTGWTGFLRASASGAGGVTVSSDGAFKDPQDDTEAGYITIRVGSTDYQIPFYASS